jgi:hypothetical protein
MRLVSEAGASRVELGSFESGPSRAMQEAAKARHQFSGFCMERTRR